MLDAALRADHLWSKWECALIVHNLLNKDAYIPTYEPAKYHDLLLPGRSILVRVGVRF
jgi:hypothetical protein